MRMPWKQTDQGVQRRVLSLEPRDERLRQGTKKVSATRSERSLSEGEDQRRRHTMM